MNSEDMNNICRTCLTTFSNVEIPNLLGSVSENLSVTYAEMLSTCTSLNISANDGLPFTLCSYCLESLVSSYNFRIKCIQSDENFRKLMKNNENLIIFLDKKSPKNTNEHIIANIKEETKGTTVNCIMEGDSDTNLKSKNSETNQRDSSVIFPCRKCDKCFISYNDLAIHNQQHPKTDKINCHICNQEFMHPRHIAPHIARAHPNNLQAECGYCEFKYHNQTDIRTHLLQHKHFSNEVADTIFSEAIERALNESVEMSTPMALLDIKNELVFGDIDNCDTVSLSDSHNNIKESQMICEICSKEFKSLTNLKRHILTHDPDKPYHCTNNKCKWSFASEHELQTHIIVNHSDGKNECVLCQKVFREVRLLRQHMISHKQTKRFRCSFCLKGFNLMHHLKNHEKIHTKELQFLCSECGKGFVTKDRLSVHQMMHSGKKSFVCHICSKAYITNSSLKSHMKIHCSDKPFMCNHCGLTFTAKFNLNKHLRSIHNSNSDSDSCNQNMCGVCKAQCETSNELTEHMKIHTCRYYCEICSKAFSLMSALETHVKTHASGDRSHICQICGSAFNRPEHLKYHIMRRHTMQKPFKCQICNKGFIQSGELNIHMRRHTGERPYVCKVCSRGFNQSNALTSHMRTHTGEKPYICGVCHKGHCTSGGLTQHMRSHNKTPTVEEITISV